MSVTQPSRMKEKHLVVQRTVRVDGDEMRHKTWLHVNKMRVDFGETRAAIYQAVEGEFLGSVIQSHRCCCHPRPPPRFQRLLRQHLRSTSGGPPFLNKDHMIRSEWDVPSLKAQTVYSLKGEFPQHLESVDVWEAYSSLN